MSRYIQRTDGDWWTIKNRVVFKISCCDCGLVHDVAVDAPDLPEGKAMGISASVNRRATGAKRRNKKFQSSWRAALAQSPEAGRIQRREGAKVSEDLYDVSNVNHGPFTKTAQPSGPVAPEPEKLSDANEPRLKVIHAIEKCGVDAYILGIPEAEIFNTICRAVRDYKKGLGAKREIVPVAPVGGETPEQVSDRTLSKRALYYANCAAGETQGSRLVEIFRAAFIDVLHLEREHWEAKLARLESERDKAQMSLERERTQVAELVKSIELAVNSRHWLTEGRGPYEWDDDRWHLEFKSAAIEILDSLKPFKKIAADWSDCPTSQEQIKLARMDWKDRAENAEAERDNLREWKRQALESLAKWNKVEELIRSSKDVKFGVFVQDEALRFLAERDGLRAALGAIRKGVAEDYRPHEGYFPMRKFLDDRGIFNDDIQEEAVIVAVIDAALAGAPSVEGERK